MTIATVAELVAQERSSGSTDEQICRLLNASRTRPEVGRAWNVQKLEDAFGPRLQGLVRR